MAVSVIDPNKKKLFAIRRKFPALPVAAAAKVKALVDQGKHGEAEAHAKQTIAASKNLQVRNKIGVQHRLNRVQFLKYQVDTEKKTKSLFQALYGKIEKMLISSTASDGKIPPVKLKGILDRLKTYVQDAFAEFNVLLSGAVRDSIKMGLTTTMDSAQAGLDFRKQMTEMDSIIMDDFDDMAKAVEADRKALIPRTSITFKNLFDKVKQRMLKRDLFTGKKSAGPVRAFSLSSNVWDLRNTTLSRLKNRVARGIANGEASTSIASDVKGMTIIGQISDTGRLDFSYSPGVYKTAYRNALRMTRTETNNAYVESQLEYADSKDYQEQWHISGPDACPECTAYDGKIFDPNDVPYPVHPNDSCYFTTVIPGLS